jgi:hypothetical protein
VLLDHTELACSDVSSGQAGYLVDMLVGVCCVASPSFRISLDSVRGRLLQWRGAACARIASSAGRLLTQPRRSDTNFRARHYEKARPGLQHRSCVSCVGRCMDTCTPITVAVLSACPHRAVNYVMRRMVLG